MYSEVCLNMFVCMYVCMQVEEKTHHNDHAVQVIKFFALDGSEEGLVNKPHSNHNNSGHNKNSNHNNFSYHSNHNYFSTHSTTSTDQPDKENVAVTVVAADSGDSGDAVPVPNVFNTVVNETAPEKEVKFAVDAEKVLSKYDESLLKKPKIKQVRLG